MPGDDVAFEKSGLYAHATYFQKTSGVLALICAMIGWFLILAWMGGKHYSQGCYGGFNFNELIFNFHPVLMYGGMILCSLTALLSYRILPYPKYYTKTFHGIMHTFGVTCIVLGICAVTIGNNYKSKNDAGTYYPNLYSLHSFIGLGAIIVYFQNFFFGVYHFLSSVQSVPVESRRSYMPFHVFLGFFAFVLSLLAVQTGIAQLTGETCAYEVDEPDLNPASHYHLLSYGCKLANGAGIMVMLVALFGLFALYNFRGEERKSESIYLLSH
jgi:cytochrome b-561